MITIESTPPPARPWLLVSTEAGRDMFGTPVPAGTAIARQMWNGVTPWKPPAGIEVVPDDGRPIWQPRPPAEPASALPDLATWLARFPPPVLLEIVAAALREPALLLALLLPLARGRLDLADPHGELGGLLALARQHTAETAHPLTEELAQAMLTS